MNLFEINNQITELIEKSVDPETGEIDETALATLEEMQLTKKEKIENVGLYILSIKAFINAINNQIDVFKMKKEKAEKELEWMESYIGKSLEYENFKSEKVDIKFRKSEQIKVVDEKELNDFIKDHPEYQNVEIKVKPKLAELKKAYKEGKETKGVIIEVKQNVTVS